MIERYTRKEMGEIWSLANRFQSWLEVELAVCRAWEKLGQIPAQDLDIIESRAKINVPRILEIEEQTKHDVIAFLTSLEEEVGASARFIHVGCTSSDIVDTANSLLMVRAGRMILADFDLLLNALKDLAFAHKGLLMIGRTHGVHAEPTTFGLKMAGFYAEFVRHKNRFAAALEGMRVGKISGAVGGYAHLDPEVESLALAELGLEVDPLSTQIIQRDRHAHYFTALALAAGGVERLCVELRHLQRTEVLEVEEGFSKGQKGSSAMPHKKNPISAENMTGLSRLVRSNSLAAMENMALWHERDISHSSVERVIMPDSTILIDYTFNRLAGMLKSLKVNAAKMERNLKASHGLFFSQRVLLALVEAGLERQKAYEMVQKLALRCWDEGCYFPDAVSEAVETAKEKDGWKMAFPSKEKLTEIFDLHYYLRHEDLIFGRVFG